MGEVWRARDTRLGREVAIKALPTEFAQDSDRRNRFEHEARALAALNHSNVGAIYGLEERDGSAFLVLELIEGPTLADELARGPLPLERTLSIAAQIAEGLEAAHDANIIHRDLKPSNIKIRPDGSVKILDFGLARSVAASPPGALSQSPTVLTGTLQGVILGTVAYMSPEQARGGVVDKRTDIFAFGCVLYECLTGRQAFGGVTTTDSLAATLKSDPDWRLVPEGVPAQVPDLLRRCLEKNPRQRLQSIGDARVMLTESMSAVASAPPMASSTTTSPEGRRWPAWTAAAAIAAALALGVVVGRFGWPGVPPPVRRPSVRALIPIPPSLSLSMLQGLPGLTISPDGQTVVFRAQENGVSQLYRRALDGTTVEPIAGTEGAFDPFFSPDGQWVAFFAQSRLKKVSMGGGAPIVLCSVPPVGGGGTWTADGSIIFSPGPNFGLARVSPDGGAVEEWSHLDAARGEHGHVWPQALPGNRLLVTIVFGHDFQDVNAARAVILAPGQKPRDLQEGSAFARIVPGWLVFLRGDTVLAAPVDEDRLEVTGPPVRVAESIAIGAVRRVPHFAASQDGTLVFAGGPPITPPTYDMVRIDRFGKATPVAPDADAFAHIRLAPDGKRLVLTRQEGMAMRLFLFDIDRSVLSPLTPDPGRYFDPAWSPDGKRIAYTRFAEGVPKIYVRNADSSETQSPVTDSTDAEFLGSFSPDGQTLAYTVNYVRDRSSNQQRATTDIWLLSLDRRSPPRRWFESAGSEYGAEFSPDGRSIAYVSDESGRLEVYVRPFPGPGGRIQVSNQGGSEPAWSANGREIVYREADRFMSVAFAASPVPSVSAPRQLFSGPYLRGGRDDDPRAYDIARDGSFVVALRARPREPAQHQLFVMTNWAQGLGQK